MSLEKEVGEPEMSAGRKAGFLALLFCLIGLIFGLCIGSIFVDSTRPSGRLYCDGKEPTLFHHTNEKCWRNSDGKKICEQLGEWWAVSCEKRDK